MCSCICGGVRVQAEQRAEEEREALRQQQRQRHAEERRQDMVSPHSPHPTPIRKETQDKHHRLGGAPPIMYRVSRIACCVSRITSMLPPLLCPCYPHFHAHANPPFMRMEKKDAQFLLLKCSLYRAT